MPGSASVRSWNATHHISSRAAALVGVALFLAAQPAVLSAAAQAAAEPDRRAVATEVDRLFGRWNSTDLPGCTVGVAVNGEQVINRSYGMAELEHGLANRPDTIIEAGSVSKQFTAAAVLLLVQDGRISLDDEVRRYIPELPDEAKAVTVRQLLTHTSGLRDWGNLQDIAGWPRTRRAYTHDHVLDIVARQRHLNFAPGTDFSYTNTGYNLAVVLVERVTGQSFADFCRTALFEPLGMTRTSWRDDFTRIVRDRANGYTVSDEGVSLNMPFESVHGNGGLLTTVGDLLRWSENAVHAKVGGPTFVETQHTKGRLADGQDIVYTLGGLYRQEWRGIPEISHSGGTAGYRAWLARYPEERLTVAVLCNASDAPAWTLGRQVAELFLSLPATSAPQPASVGAPVLEAISGLYRNRRTSAALAIDLIDGQLRVAGLGALTPLTPDVLQVGTGAIRLEIERDPTGKVVGARSTVSGETTSYERTEPSRPTLAQLQELAGTYESDEAEVRLTVQVVDGALVLRRRPNTVIPLEPTYADGFSGSIGHVRFLRDASGKVTHFSIGRDRVFDIRFARVGATSAPQRRPR